MKTKHSRTSKKAQPVPSQLPQKRGKPQNEENVSDLSDSDESIENQRMQQILMQTPDNKRQKVETIIKIEKSAIINATSAEGKQINMNESIIENTKSSKATAKSTPVCEEAIEESDDGSPRAHPEVQGSDTSSVSEHD